jgi:hypothetical protein
MSSRQNAKPEILAVAQPGLDSLGYLVFDGHKLVAAFARRHDAEHCLEECGHPAMDVRKMGALDRFLPSRRGARAGQPGEKTGGAVTRRR